MTTPTLKPGTVFVHAVWLGEDMKPLRCVVTAIRRGMVYWRREDALKAKACFGLDQIGRYVRQIL